MFETWYKMVAMLQGGLDLSPVVTHRFPVEAFQGAFDVMRSGRSGKVILDWTDRPAPGYLRSAAMRDGGGAGGPT